ncbi:hypothetical protein [Roseomonas elaeocarpi]|uniref:Secreted protein n=1 Tax=Roseomonas elaeocarpi TaxID=907779 RepID=A0ABV6JMG4_9PROT
MIRPLLALLLLLAQPALADGDLDARLDRFGDAFPAGAPPMPVCNRPREGVAACLAGKQCVCRFERGGSITGRPDGFRWDCGVLQADCPAAPAAVAPPPALDPALGAALPYLANPYGGAAAPEGIGRSGDDLLRGR